MAGFCYDFALAFRPCVLRRWGHSDSAGDIFGCILLDEVCATSENNKNTAVRK